MEPLASSLSFCLSLSLREKSNINSGGKFLFQEKRRREKEGSTALVEVGSGEERLKKQQERKEKGKRTNWSILEEA